MIWYPPRVTGTLAQKLFDASNTETRMRAAISIIRSLPIWWKSIPAPLFPFPADIVIDEAGDAHLLGVPAGGLPDPQAVTKEPQRLRYLSPELIRSSENIQWDEKLWQAVDRYSIGVTCLQAVFQLPEILSFDSTASRIAGGVYFSKMRNRVDLPHWLGRFSSFAKTMDMLKRLVSSALTTRQGIDLNQLADRLESQLEFLDPHTAAAWLRDASQPQEALELLEDLFPTVEQNGVASFQRARLFCLAGDLCARYLARPLDAIDYFERAIDADQNTQSAYREELIVIANARHQVALADIICSDPHVAADIDYKIWRNYKALFGDRTIHAVNEDDAALDHLIANHLLWQGKFLETQQFVHPRLSDEAGTYMWWDFEMMMAYVKSFIGLDTGDGQQLAAAASQLQQIKDGLKLVEGKMSIEPNLVHQVGSEVAHMEVEIATLQSKLQ